MRWADIHPRQPFGLAILVLVVSAGCSGGNALPDFVEHLAPAQGKVTMKGKPLEGAMVTFHPADPNSRAMAAYGNTDATGAYEMKTIAVGHGPQLGAVEGEYVVTISKIAMKDGSPIPPDMSDADAEAEGAREVIPPQYNRPERSQLKARVAKEAAQLDFSL